MVARAIWKGSLKIGSATIPIKIYAAVEDRDVHFHVLQKTTKSRVKQEMVTENRQPVEKEEVRKGYEIEPGTFVTVSASELQRLKPKESRIVSMLRFVPVSQLGNEWYERPYYLGPEAEVSNYFA